jgi:RNA polymerase sigma factor (sigma-70 family)
MRYRAIEGVLRYIRKIAPAPEEAALGDGALLERFVARRDEAAFETLLQRHGPMVLGVCRRMLDDPHAVDDAFQVTFLVFLQKAHSLRRQNLLGNWLYGVAYRTSLKARSLAARRRPREQPLQDASAPEAGDDLAWRDLRTVLDEEINRLPLRYRQPILLCYLEGKTVTEAARQLGWPAGSVAGRLARAKERLRQRFIKRGITLGAGLLGHALPDKLSAGASADLMARTVQQATLFLEASAVNSGTLSPSALALMEGVTQAMFMHKVKITVVCLAAGAILSGGALSFAQRAGKEAQVKQVKQAEAARPDEQPPEEYKLVVLGREKAIALLQTSGLSDRMKALLTEKYEAAEIETTERWKRLIGGHETLDIMLSAAHRLLEAERELSGKKADQLVSLENHLRRMQVLEKIFRLRFDGGSAALQDLSQARFCRVQAEILLERAKGP